MTQDLSPGFRELTVKLIVISEMGLLLCDVVQPHSSDQPHVILDLRPAGFRPLYLPTAQWHERLSSEFNRGDTFTIVATGFSVPYEALRVVYLQNHRTGRSFGVIPKETPSRPATEISELVQVNGLMYIDGEDAVWLHCHPIDSSRSFAYRIPQALLEAIDEMGLATGDMALLRIRQAPPGMECSSIMIQKRGGGKHLQAFQRPSAQDVLIDAELNYGAIGGDLGDPYEVIISQEAVQHANSNPLLFLSTILVENYTLDDRLTISSLLDLPIDQWTSQHRDKISLALAHFLAEATNLQEGLPPPLLAAIRKIPAPSLPPLDKPLTDQLRDVFSRLFRHL